MPGAIVLGGNGLVGRAVALRLAADGWEVEASGRAADRFPGERHLLLARGGRGVNHPTAAVNLAALAAQLRRP